MYTVIAAAKRKREEEAASSVGGDDKRVRIEVEAPVQPSPPPAPVQSSYPVDQQVQDLSPNRLNSAPLAWAGGNTPSPGTIQMLATPPAIVATLERAFESTKQALVDGKLFFLFLPPKTHCVF